MSDPEVPPFIRQQQVIEQIARAVVAASPQPWSKASYRVKSVAPYQQHGIYLTRPDGSEELEFPPDELVDLDDELRAVMYRPGAGTWFSAEIVISAEGAVDANFNYDDEPAWTRPVEAIWYAQDLDKYPRDEPARPAWLRQRLSEAFAAE